MAFKLLSMDEVHARNEYFDEHGCFPEHRSVVEPVVESKEPVEPRADSIFGDGFIGGFVFLLIGAFLLGGIWILMAALFTL